MSHSSIHIEGARQHNLKNLSLDIPRDELVVVCGPSGSGKSTLAFDIVYAEGQRRYVESLSAYARQFLPQMDKPDVDKIEGLSPAISLEQQTTGRNPRSTVGTVTEVYDFLRVFFARLGKMYCPQCGRPIEARAADEIIADILALPGVGPYTAGAIASTAYNEEVPCVDGNVERVLSRVFDIDTPVKEEPAKSRIRELAQALIPKGEARNFNQGLMELGALVCRKKPECERCPRAGLCESRHLGIQNERPVPGKKAAVTQIEVVCGVLLHEGKVFIQRRNEKDVWGGLWEFPGGCVEPGETPEQAVVREWMEEVGFKVAIVRPLGVIRHNYTTYRITLRCYQLRLEGEPKGCPVPEELAEATACQWIAPQNIEAFPLPAPHRKLADNCSLFDNPASGE